MTDPAWWAQSDQIDASLRETKAILSRLANGPSVGQVIADMIRELRDAVAALEERVTKLEKQS